MSSIPANIVEGCVRESDADFRRFLIIALGSASEVEYLLLLSFELTYIAESDYQVMNPKIVSLRKQLRNLIDKLK